MPRGKKGDEFYFWESEERSTTTIRDIRVESFARATGEAKLYFDSHAIGLLETRAAGTIIVNSSPPRTFDYPASTSLFVPKHQQVISRPAAPLDTTVFIIPDHWFQRAIESDSGFQGAEFVYMEADGATVLTNAVSLLKSVAVEDPRQSLPPMVDTLISAIVVRILRITCGVQQRWPAVDDRNLSEKQIALLVAFIDANIGRAIRLGELAELAGMSESHFSRMFKAAMRMPPMRFVQTRRIESAKVRLLDRGQSLVMVALLCGFASQSHFTTAFRQLVGVTPAAYRAGLKLALPWLSSHFLLELVQLIELA